MKMKTFFGLVLTFLILASVSFTEARSVAPDDTVFQTVKHQTVKYSKKGYYKGKHGAKTGWRKSKHASTKGWHKAKYKSKHGFHKTKKKIY